MTENEWNKRKQEYPYNVIDLLVKEKEKHELVECLRCLEDLPKLTKAIELVISELPKELKRVFFMHVKGRLPLNVIAKTEDITVEAVKDRIDIVIKHLCGDEQYKIIQKHIGYKMPMGAIVGDIVGSKNAVNGAIDGDFDFFTLKDYYSVSSLLTIAVAKSLSVSKDSADDEIRFALKNAMLELNISTPIANEVVAVAVSFVGYLSHSEEEVKRLVGLVAEVACKPKKTQEEAEAVAMTIFLAKDIRPRYEICYKIRHQYYHKLFPQGSFLQSYSSRLVRYEELCRMFNCKKATIVPAAVACAFASESFEDAVHKATMIGANSSTLVAITGAIAEAFYGGVPHDLKIFVKMYFPKSVWKTLNNIRWSV